MPLRTRVPKAFLLGGPPAWLHASPDRMLSPSGLFLFPRLPDSEKALVVRSSGPVVPPIWALAYHLYSGSNDGQYRSHRAVRGLRKLRLVEKSARG